MDNRLAAALRTSWLHMTLKWSVKIAEKAILPLHLQQQLQDQG